jgi:hypothetical protein
MPWIAGKTMRLGEHQVQKGTVLSAKVISAVPTLRWNALMRTGLVREVEDSQVGEMCPICGQGPFSRLARHTTAVHDDELIAEAAAEVQVEEEAVGEEE